MDFLKYAADAINAKKDQFLDNQNFKRTLTKAMSSKLTEVTTKELYEIADKSYE